LEITPSEQARLSERIRRLLEELNQDLFEKEKVVGLALLSAIAGESIFLLGPPGVAKSMVARRLKYAFQHAQSFEYLMGKFSTPDEIFGPVSISKLRDEDRYERLTEHYLPGAQIVFLDEIWKASPPIQNALLTVLNEKIFRNGEKEIKVDLRGLIAASNELPLAGEGLEALWDRFLIRLVVEGIENKELFNAMITLSGGSAEGDYVNKELKISDEEYKSWSEAIDYIFVPPHILGVIDYLRSGLQELGQDQETEADYYISDRRWRKIVRLLRTAAFLNGRRELDLMDCFLIADCIWGSLDQRAPIQELIIQTIEQHGYRALYDLGPALQSLRNLEQEIESSTQVVTKEKIEETVVHKDQQGVQYVKIANFWGEDAAYLRVSDYQKLSKEKEIFVPVFEKSYETYRPFQSYSFLLTSSKTLLNKQKKYQLETQLSDKEIVSNKKPDKALLARWDGQVDELLDHCRQALQILAERQEQDLQHLKNHIFVPRQFAQHVKTSLKKAGAEVLNFKLEIEKVQHGYQSMGSGG
jgi:MoxR-like ATPase